MLVGRRMQDVPLDDLPGKRREYTANFHVANTWLNEALFSLSGLLQERGSRVFPVPYLEMPDWNLEKRPALLLQALRPLLALSRVREAMSKKVLWENLSYHHMTVEAGLGEIGISNLLPHPEHGTRLRFVALLTDAELPAGKP